MLAWCTLFLIDASVGQQAARRSLGAASLPHIAAPQPALDRATSLVPPAPVVLRGMAIAELTIPRVDLSAIVLHGSDTRTLRRGPGHLENTPLPGQAGNAVIAGHRDSFFRPLRDVEIGDDVFIATPAGRLHYRVASLAVVHPRDLSVLEPTADEVLTLITCFPFELIGPAPDRFIVRATRIQE